MRKIWLGTFGIGLIVVLVFSLSICMGSKSNGISNLNLHEVREIAWKSVENNRYGTITTPWEEARVELIDSKDRSIVPIDNEQRKQLEQLLNDNSTLLAVTFHTEQDGLLGPIVPIINPNTMKVIGFYPRY